MMEGNIMRKIIGAVLGLLMALGVAGLSLAPAQATVGTEDTRVYSYADSSDMAPTISRTASSALVSCDYGTNYVKRVKFHVMKLDGVSAQYLTAAGTWSNSFAEITSNLRSSSTGTFSGNGFSGGGGCFNYEDIHLNNWPAEQVTLTLPITLPTGFNYTVKWKTVDQDGDVNAQWVGPVGVAL